MICPPRPENEEIRLAGLRALGILDTPPEERFDVVTRLACQVFQVQTALVSLIDEDRQWFKSRQGMQERERPRDTSFCGHAILRPEVLVVSDATKDVRFHDNPVVNSESPVRFYAGYPLSVDGVRVGTLCIIDSKPRDFSESDRKMLADLGRLVERELKAREMISIDELTGLVNRRGLELTGRHLVEASLRTLQPVTVLFFDLDGFKQINDTFGHEEGDRAIRDFGDCLQKAFRRSDLVARLGGDEFCVLVSTSPPDKLERALDALREIVEHRNAKVLQGQEIRYTCGRSTFNPCCHHGFDDVVRDADRDMYANKPVNR